MSVESAAMTTVFVAPIGVKRIRIKERKKNDHHTHHKAEENPRKKIDFRLVPWHEQIQDA